MSFPADSMGSQPAYSNSQPQTYPHPGYSRSFGSLPAESYGGAHNVAPRNAGPVAVYEGGGKAQIYTVCSSCLLSLSSGRKYVQIADMCVVQAVYSGVSVYEMEINGIACMRRRSDGWLNATQILKVAGVDKGKRTKVLEKEILTGEHEKVQGGYGKYQGTWISYKRGREFCRQYGVEDILRPLLDYDVSSDGTGTGGQGEKETPTKEQAMAANRKRFYGSAGVPENVRQSGPATNGGTFFSNISPTTSVALAAMNKAARLNSPAPRTSSGLRRPSMNDAFPGGSQQSFMSEGSLGGREDSGYGTQPNGEPPRKRLRPDSQDGNNMAPPGLPSSLPLDASMRSATPTEPNESFVYDGTISQELINGNGEPIAQAPLPTPTTDDQQDKVSLLLDLFAEPGSSRTDYSTHPALTQLSGEDLNIPLDASANNALHWAATLAKVSLLKLLIQRGANIYRGNAAGQSPLISAVLVNNCWEQSCFPELLELLGPLIEIRDIQGRTILHHIAVSSGIKGRAGSSKYYLEALLEFLVRIGTHSSGAAGTFGASTTAAQTAAAIQDAAMSSQDSNSAPVPTAPVVQSAKGPVTLVRFLSHIVNARDKAGNTALNLVARVGNRSIIQQLIEIHADPSLPNYKGVSAKDFGVDIGNERNEKGSGNGNGSQVTYALGGETQDSTATVADGDAGADGATAETSAAGASNQVEDLGQDVITSMTTMLTQSLTSHKETLRQRTEQIDALNAQIQEFSASQKAELEKVMEMKEKVRSRSERQARIAKLKSVISEKRRRPHKEDSKEVEEEIQPKWLEDVNALEILSFDSSPDGTSGPNTLQRSYLSSTPLPSPPQLRSLTKAYEEHNHTLRTHSDALASRSAELEGMYRKVVSLCTGVEEGKVEESLGGLVAAVESEQGGMGVQEVGRVREFLRRVEGGAGAGMAVVEG